MVIKKLWLIILIFIFGITITGCDQDDNKSGGFTFEFKIKSENSGYTIEEINFYNGSSQLSELLKTEIVNINYPETSNVYRVSGFTNDQFCFEEFRNWCISIRAKNNNTSGDIFRYSNGHAENNTKILIVFHSTGLSTLEGDW